MYRNKVIVALISFSLSHILYAANEELIFATAPTHSTEETTKLYTPIINYLSHKTGKKFKLDLPTNFIEYSKRMQDDKYDLVFDGPHLAAWRVDRLQHTPIVKFPGQIKIVIAAMEQSKLTKLSDLQYGTRVCAFVPPNMLTMAMLSHFPSPAKQPHLIRVQGFKNLMECLISGKGDAAVFRDSLWDKAQKAGETKGLKIIATPQKAYPERTLTVGPKIDSGLQVTISQLLLSDEGQKISTPLLNRFKKQKFVTATPEEYHGLSNLINTVWGFQ